MKRKIAALICAAALLLSGCSAKKAEGDGGVCVVATSYPVYIFAMNVLDGVEGVDLELMVDQQISCIHDYTLSVNDMMLLEKADLLLISGAGLEEFLTDALKAYPELPTVDCSDGIALKEQGGETDPHIWLDPMNAAAMTENIMGALAEYFPDSSSLMANNCESYCSRLYELNDELYNELSPLNAEIVTFHNGFAYFADAFGITILHSIEEEAGSEASAEEINEIISLIESNGVKAVFTEINGSDATAKAIARETGIGIGTLNTAVYGEKTLTGYEDIMRENAAVLVEALG